MNELKFLEVIGKIDDDLIREANNKKVPESLTSKHFVYATGSVAAAIMIVVSVVFFSARKPSNILAEYSAPPETTQKQSTTQESRHYEQSEKNHSEAYFYKNFAATIDPNADGYGEEELPIVCIIVSGNYYYQLDSSEHPAHNISSAIKNSDFGDYIGKITELFEYDNPAKYPVSSKEPKLSGVDVYYYAPAESHAVIIAKKGQQCSIFVFNGMASEFDSSSIFADTFKLYGASSAEDIDNIAFSIAVPNGSIIEISARGTITDREKINAITDVLFQLKSEEKNDALSGSPEWLNDAWNAYRANPDAFVREDIMFDITFKNGTVLKDIIYQPYLSNGYVASMQELTPEENAKLKEAFN